MAQDVGVGVGMVQPLHVPANDGEAVRWFSSLAVIKVGAAQTGIALSHRGRRNHPMPGRPCTSITARMKRVLDSRRRRDLRGR